MAILVSNALRPYASNDKIEVYSDLPLKYKLGDSPQGEVR